MRRSDNSIHIIGWLFFSVLTFTSIAVPAGAQDQLQWHSFEEAISIAEETNKPIFIDIWAPWCGWCRKMKKETYPGLATELSSNYVLTRLNRDDNKSTITFKGQELTPLRLAQKLKAQTVPTVALLSARGNYLLHITGFTKEESLEPVLRYISSEAYKSQSFEVFIQKRSSDR